MKKELGRIIEALGRSSERDLSLFDESFLTKSIKNRMAVTSIRTAAAYLDYLVEHDAEAEELLRSLTITYSGFFRNPPALVLLEHLILPRLLENKSGRGEVRIWSAGCAAGQEPYSLAMLLDDLAAKRETPDSWRIFATDASEAELALARKGVYDYAAVHNVRLKYIRNYFRQQGETYTVDTGLRDRLAFSCYDLLDRKSASPPESIYGSFDLVSCSNLLFYYREDIQQHILKKIRRSLSKGGYLMTGEAERAIVEKAGGFQAVALPAGVYRKTDAG